jgi:hypothetical protein
MSRDADESGVRWLRASVLKGYLDATFARGDPIEMDVDSRWLLRIRYPERTLQMMPRTRCTSLRGFDSIYTEEEDGYEKWL